MSELIIKRENYRLWFEFYKIALKSESKIIQRALKKSKVRYERWGNVAGATFDMWWKAHAFLFEETKSVRVLQEGEIVHPNESLIVEMPLNRSARELASQVRRIVVLAHADMGSKKSQRKPSTAYKLTAGAEPKLAALRTMLNVYRDAYLINPTLRGEELLQAARSYYGNRKTKRTAKVPMSLQGADGRGVVGEIRAKRNLRRYIQNAEKILLNVASGEFPGKY